jgi:hypothetical protein
MVDEDRGEESVAAHAGGCAAPWKPRVPLIKASLGNPAMHALLAQNSPQIATRAFLDRCLVRVSQTRRPESFSRGTRVVFPGMAFRPSG